ncbi:ATP-dependent endonuclease [Burkholderia sp. AU16741]|uniref:ATP-dependent nuclease n=1 Tax=Burkholderia sp. AU16741 TaxID=2015347 RepID=UPI000B7AD40F|nr:AAA family ATPase [Burkholderia sp. AU16741]OXI31537.1 ATP-dependent endonuclease [Burkholderia sp. AU16741]
MRIESVRIKNLRTIKDAVVDVDYYNCFVGPNGAGKSTFLFALNVFFREADGVATDVTYLSAEDFHRKDTSEPIEITVTFCDLNDDAKQEFKEYFRQDRLIVTAKATFDPVAGRAEVRQLGERLGMAQFMHFFKRQGDKGKADELKQIYAALQAEFKLPKASSVGAMADELRNYEASLPEQCVLIPSEDQFYGVSKGANRLQKYVQWVYIPAVKDATAEQSEGRATALGRLLARTVRSKVNFTERLNAVAQQARDEYQKLLDESQGALEGISGSLQTRLMQWAHPDTSLRVSWQQDPDKSVKVEEPFAKIIAGEGTFEGDIARFGHGFQRSFLLTLLQELATESGTTEPRLILGCEEPELYQHPPQARHLASVLNRLAAGGSQVLATTHSPLFVSGESFESVRLVRRHSETKASYATRPSPAKIGEEYARLSGEPLVTPRGSLARIAQILQPTLSEIFFAQRLVLVEGIEDVAYIHAWMTLTDRMLDFRKAGCHIVPVDNKSHLLRPAIIARQLEIPTFLLFDGDADCDEKYKAHHVRDNAALLKMLGGDDQNPIPTETVWGADYTMWHTNLGQTVDSELISNLGSEGFERIKTQAHLSYGNAKGLQKNPLFIGAKLAFALDEGAGSESLNKLCTKILEFGTL